MHSVPRYTDNFKIMFSSKNNVFESFPDNLGMSSIYIRGGQNTADGLAPAHQEILFSPWQVPEPCPAQVWGVA